MDQWNIHGRNGKVQKSFMHPNCKLKKLEVNGLPRMCVFAINEIKKGDEVTFDYNWECDDDQNMTECKCGTENCKGCIDKNEKLRWRLKTCTMK